MDSIFFHIFKYLGFADDHLNTLDIRGFVRTIEVWNCEIKFWHLFIHITELFKESK